MRLSLVALLCLLLGAATTVGVAWRAALQWRWGADMSKTKGAAAECPWPVWAGSGTTTEYESRRTWGREMQTWYSGNTMAEQSTSGWPLVALISRGVRPGDLRPERISPGWEFVSSRIGLRVMAKVTYPTSKSFGYPYGYATKAGVIGVAHLPMAILWPGFALDTALYAAAWWALLFTPLPLYRLGRRRFRVSRGMCGDCGYDLKGSPGGACSECGGVP